jgi:hypothetical protein
MADNLTFGVTNVDLPIVSTLLAGSADVNTAQGTAGGAIGKLAVIGRVTSSGALVVVDTAASNGSQIAIGIAVHAAASGKPVQYYNSGCFNSAALTWPAALDTLVKRQAAFDRTPISIGTVVA